MQFVESAASASVKTIIYKMCYCFTIVLSILSVNSHIQEPITQYDMARNRQFYFFMNSAIVSHDKSWNSSMTRKYILLYILLSYTCVRLLWRLIIMKVRDYVNLLRLHCLGHHDTKMLRKTFISSIRCWVLWLSRF